MDWVQWDRAKWTGYIGTGLNGLVILGQVLNGPVILGQVLNGLATVVQRPNGIVRAGQRIERRIDTRARVTG